MHRPQPHGTARAVPHRRLALAAAAVLALAGTAAQAQFRVNPYLQNPSSQGMSFTWFTENAASATFKLFEGTSTTPSAAARCRACACSTTR